MTDQTSLSPPRPLRRRDRRHEALAQSPHPDLGGALRATGGQSREGPRGEPQNGGRGAPDLDGQTARATRIPVRSGWGLGRNRAGTCSRGRPGRGRRAGATEGRRDGHHDRGFYRRVAAQVQSFIAYGVTTLQTPLQRSQQGKATRSDSRYR